MRGPDASTGIRPSSILDRYPGLFSPTEIAIIFPRRGSIKFGGTRDAIGSIGNGIKTGGRSFRRDRKIGLTSNEGELSAIYSGQVRGKVSIDPRRFGKSDRVIDRNFVRVALISGNVYVIEALFAGTASTGIGSKIDIVACASRLRVRVTAITV